MRVIGLTIPGAFSGADAAIFSGLRERGLLSDVVASHVPLSTRAALLARTFQPSKVRWGTAWRRVLDKTPTAFLARSAANDRLLRARTSQFDIVLQVSGLFAPFVGDAPRSIALFCDYTTRLAEIHYPPWFGLEARDADVWYALETELYRNASMVMTGSENTRRSVINDYGASPDRVLVVGEGVRHVPDVGDKRYDARRVLFVGIDFDRKGGAYLLEAFRTVKKRVPDAELHIVGPAARAAQPGVVWHGHISDPRKLADLYATATVLTLPSLCDPFGLALIEGMAHRLPVVGTLVDAMPEIVEQGITGFLVPAAEAGALAERLVHLLQSPSLCEQMGRCGQQTVRDRFMWSQVVDRVVEGLSEALDGAASSQVA